MYKNYLFLNKEEQNSNNIYNLTQYYLIKDTILGFSETIGIYYLERRNQFALESNKLEIRFNSNDDYLKVKALNYIYQPETQSKLKELIKAKRLKAPFIKIAVDGNRNTYFVLVKEKDKPHNYPL